MSAPISTPVNDSGGFGLDDEAIVIAIEPGGHSVGTAGPLTLMLWLPVASDGIVTFRLNDPAAFVVVVPSSTVCVFMLTVTGLEALKFAPDTVICSPANGVVVLTPSEAPGPGG